MNYHFILCLWQSRRILSAIHTKYTPQLLSSCSPHLPVHSWRRTKQRLCKTTLRRSSQHCSITRSWLTTSLYLISASPRHVQKTGMLVIQRNSSDQFILRQRRYHQRCCFGKTTYTSHALVTRLQLKAETSGELGLLQSLGYQQHLVWNDEG